MKKLLMTSRQKTQMQRPNLWLEHFARTINRSMGQLQVESLQKSNHFLDGSTSRFKYEDIIDDWLDLTVLGTSKRGPALKNRLFGDAEMYQGVLNRESLRVEDGVKYFRDKLSQPFCERGSKCFPLEISLFYSSKKRIGNFSLLLKRVKDSWIDLFPLSAMTEQQRESKYQANMT